jgi:hypothetical protein
VRRFIEMHCFAISRDRKGEMNKESAFTHFTQGTRSTSKRLSSIMVGGTSGIFRFVVVVSEFEDPLLP